MSDSDEELVSNDVFRYPHERKNMINSSNFAMHSQFNKNFDLRSIGSRRETSTISLKSFRSSRMPYQHGYYPTAMSSRGSVYNGRCRSPMSVRSFDSSISLSAADIASAIKNLKCSNRKELQMVQDAYKMYIKKYNRRRIEKRRNLKSFMRQFKRSGGDSGEEGSDSSISSDDCRSTRSALYKENLSLPRSKSRKNIHEIMGKIREHDLYKDCTKAFQQTTFTFNACSQNNKSTNIQISNEKLQEVYNDKNVAEKKNMSVSTLKDRFANSASVMPLPSERFTTKPTSIQELCNKDVINHIQKDVTNGKNCESDSGSDEIFSQTIHRSDLSRQQKRVLETEDSYPSRKRIRSIDSPERQHAGPSLPKPLCRNNTINEFPFKKPQLPARKSNHNHNQVNTKDTSSEILLAKCSQPLVGNIVPITNQSNHLSQLSNNKDKEEKYNKTKSMTENVTETINDTNCTESTLNSTDISTKPSFIKRKLFTQKLDVVENNNLSSDNLSVNSPQAKLVRACREKNKVRKLVTSQSCLSRDVTTDDNVLDLIHKIVPAHQMNITNVANKQADTNLEKQNRDSKWDVTSVLSMCNNEDASDTYTDEEIFNGLHNEKRKCKDISNQNDVQKIPKVINNSHKKQEKENIKECKLVIEKLPKKFNCQNNEVKENTCSNTKTVSNCVKSFWDTDFESDLEDLSGLPWKSRLQEDLLQTNARKNNNFVGNKKHGLRCTTITIKKFQNNGTISNVKSDFSHVPKKNASDIHQENTEKNNNEVLNKSKRQKQKKAKQDKKKENSISRNDGKQVHQNCKLQTITKATIETDKKSEKSIVNVHNNTKNIESPQTILNKSRESIRLKEKREAKQKFNNSIQTESPQVASNRLNTSRESLRLKQKREANINGTNLSKKQNSRNRQI